MPNIKFIEKKCAKCGETYRFSIERVMKGNHFECPACGHQIPLEDLSVFMEMIAQYNALIKNIEANFEIEGTKAIFRPRTVSAIGVGKRTDYGQVIE